MSGDQVYAAFVLALIGVTVLVVTAVVVWQTVEARRVRVCPVCKREFRRSQSPYLTMCSTRCYVSAFTTAIGGRR